MDSTTTTARRFIEAATQLGASVVFTNLGSDHPAFIEAFALFREQGRASPRIIVCPHEMTALSAAHGHAMITRTPQVVLVHVDVGTQNLGGSIHNAARGRVPAIIVAGLSPVTQDGAMTGSRNEFIHFTQDTPRQHEIVGQYMKWCYELRVASTVDDVVRRAWQIASTSPQGPVYLTGAREIWDAAVSAPGAGSAWPSATIGGLADEDVCMLARALCEAKRPLVVTSYLGRNPDAVASLVALSERFGFGVCEASPQYLNFPGSHAHHMSYRRNALIDEADLILMIDVDVPWIPSRVRPADGARVFHIDIDPIKQDLSFWHFPADRTWLADSGVALAQLLATTSEDVPGREGRGRWLADARRRAHPVPHLPGDGPITADELTAAVRELVTPGTIVIFEEPSSTEVIPPVLRLDRPGSWFASGGSGLGWGTNAAIGAKLAAPDAEVIALVGDGCYIFGVPSSTYWVADRYDTPFLTIIYNNGGWHSPKLSTLGVHPAGNAQRTDTYFVTMGSGARLEQVAAAVGSIAAFRVEAREHLPETLHAALAVVRSGRPAVVDVTIAPISSQVLA